MFSAALAASLGNKGTFALPVVRLHLRFLSRTLCHFQSDSHSISKAKEDLKPSQFVLAENWTEQARNKADFIQSKGKVYLIRNEEEESKLVRSSSVLQDFSNQEALGLDVEFIPLRGGVKVCLVQLASHDVAVLWHCRRVPPFPPFLVSLLVDGDVLKVSELMCAVIDPSSVHSRSCIDRLSIDCHRLVTYPTPVIGVIQTPSMVGLCLLHPWISEFLPPPPPPSPPLQNA